MKKLALILCLGLGGCATAQLQQNTADVVAKAKIVQAKVVQYCQFAPALASVTKLISATIGNDVEFLANEICNAATSIPLADGGTRKIIVRGVEIKGHRVR